MEIQKFENIRQALDSILSNDNDFIIVKHKLYEGQGVKRHYHKKANEWLIIDKGSLDVRIDDLRKTITPKKETIVIKFMISVKHSLDALKDSEYFLIRDYQDETYYSNRLF